MRVETLFDILDSDFYTGVPDSQLQALCNFLIDKYGISEHHVIAANEGNCTALAAGHYLATGNVPVVYMQNSGIGNIINPVASLLNDKVYAIPCIFVVGWRGEPGIHDEPQHIYQGEVTLKLLEDMDIATFVIGKETTEAELYAKMKEFRNIIIRCWNNNNRYIRIFCPKLVTKFDYLISCFLSAVDHNAISTCFHICKSSG
jgi:sulfopyruvate decarboxylase TPP-binding subunit